MKYVLALLLLCSSSVYAQSDAWTDTQKYLAASLVTATVADYGQTKYIATGCNAYNCTLREYNPLIGKRPTMERVNAVFILTPIVAYLVLDNLSSETRTKALVVMNVLEIANVSRNAYVGLKFKF